MSDFMFFIGWPLLELLGIVAIFGYALHHDRKRGVGK